MSFLRFLMLLSLIVWLGGLIFFPVVAQTSFSVLPSRIWRGWWWGDFGNSALDGDCFRHRLPGQLDGLQPVGVGAVLGFAARNVLVCLMLALTLISQFGIIPHMETLRASIPARSIRCPPTILRACSLTLFTLVHASREWSLIARACRHI